jgi:N-acetylhexosamine 1-kinase
VTDLGTAGRIAARFGGRLETVRPFGDGHINETFLVGSPSEDLVLQRINTAVFPDPEAVTANILAVYRHLGGELVPEPVPTSAGEWLVREGTAWWRAWRRVPGDGPAPAASPAALRSAGRLLGTFHGRLADLDPARLTETLPGFHDPARRLEGLRAVIAADPRGRVAGVGREIEAALADEPLAGVAAELTDRVPRRVAHFDAKLDNILFRGEEAVCFVDLDTLMPGAWFWDVGDLLRSGSAVGAEDDPDPDRATLVPERYEAIRAGYQEALSVAGVGEAPEFEAIDVAGAVVTYEQAVRFLTDWIAGDVYYRISRPTQNLDRARAQFRLLGSMPHR